MNQKYHFGNAMNILVATSTDDEEIDDLNSTLNDLMTYCLGGNASMKYEHEINFLGKFLYYFITISMDSQTPGQEYCNLSLVHCTKSHIYNGSNNSNKLIYTNLKVFQSFQYAFLSCLIPYIEMKLPIIIHSMSEAISVLKANESDINLFGRSSLLNKYKDKKSSTRRRQRMNRTGPSDHQLKYSSLLYLQKLAFFSTVNILWSVSSSTLTGRLHEAVKLIHDLHLGLFYWDHKYMTLPQRVLGIRMAAIPTASRKAGLSKMSIRVLAWLVLARFSFLGIRAVRIYLRQLHRLLLQLHNLKLNAQYNPLSQMMTSPNHSVERLCDNNNEIDGDEESKISCAYDQDLMTINKLSKIGSIDNNEDDDLKSIPLESKTVTNITIVKRSHLNCTLCMDGIINAAATPCGHLFCWDCIVHYSQRHSNSETRGRKGIIEVPCPVCRYKYKQQQIRAIYGYV